MDVENISQLSSTSDPSVCRLTKPRKSVQDHECYDSGHCPLVLQADHVHVSDAVIWLQVLLQSMRHPRRIAMVLCLSTVHFQSYC